jgi:formate--tetrahydrofolate ligase
MKTELDELIARLGLPEEAVIPCGRDVAKVDPDRVEGRERGRVVLVSAMTPTPAGEGKTTTVIGLVDGLNRAGVNAVGALREPSLGPLFGSKGGAIGGGRAKLVPGDRINLHFTGDIHAVTSAHNLLSAMLDNHVFHDLVPAIEPASILWGRALDMNDRALRKVEVGGATQKGPLRTDRFDITAASEVMAILCMSSDVEDLRARLARIVVARAPDGSAVTARDLGASGALAVLLLDAMRPNLVRTLEDNPVFVHGGPFGNIAQGTSSVRQTKLARRVADAVVTEAGFAFDLGGFKFLDLKCRAAGLRPAAVVLVVTVRALRHHGGADFSSGSDVGAVKRGLENVFAHLETMQRLGLAPPIVSLNRFPDDGAEELALVRSALEKRGAHAVEGAYFAEGGRGGEALARAVAAQLEREPRDSPDLTLPYALEESIPAKLEKVARVVLGAKGIELTARARKELEAIDGMGLGGLPICLAKTHLSISDDPEVLGRPGPFTLRVTGFRPSAGAGFVVALCGPILTMPGLPEAPAACGMDVVRDADGSYAIEGLR